MFGGPTSKHCPIYNLLPSNNSLKKLQMMRYIGNTSKLPKFGKIEESKNENKKISSVTKTHDRSFLYHQTLQSLRYKNSRS